MIISAYMVSAFKLSHTYISMAAVTLDDAPAKYRVMVEDKHHPVIYMTL